MLPTRIAGIAATLPGALLLAGLLAACAALPPAGPDAALAELRLEPPSGDDQSLVYGYLDMGDAPTPLGWMEFRQLAPASDAAFYQMRVHEGLFYLEKFPPGLFALGEFGGERYGRPLAYALPRTSPSLRITIREPGLHFVGAFKFRRATGPAGEAGTGQRFLLDAIPALRERDVLARILPFARGTPWEARIQERLARGG